VTAAEVIAAWDQADPKAIHPLRQVSEDAYWESGQAQAEMLAAVLPAGSRVVDFGCGDGRVSIPLHALGYQVTAADASRAMLDRLAAREPGIATVQSDGTSLYAGIGRKVDAAVCLAVLIHHDYSDGERIIAGLREAVKTGGLLVLDWPVADRPSEGATWISVTTWSAEQQAEVCRRVGLKRLDSDLPWGVFKAIKGA
jgi:2-polyprenyl-3-methyl-5-hydroxy-6-metoxy-1,4-benzoquinol methylase